MDNKGDIAKPELVHKLEGCTDEVNGAIIIPGKPTGRWCSIVSYTCVVIRGERRDLHQQRQVRQDLAPQGQRTVLAQYLSLYEQCCHKPDLHSS